MQNLKQWRLSQEPKLTRRELSLRSGVTEHMLYLIENGQNCSLRIARAIIDATDGEVTFEMIENCDTSRDKASA